MLETTCSLRSMIAGLAERSFLEDVVIHCSDGQTRTSGVLLAAANEFWSEALSCCPSGENAEDFQVFLLEESVAEVSTFLTDFPQHRLTRRVSHTECGSSILALFAPFTQNIDLP